MIRTLVDALRAGAAVLLPFADPSPDTGLKWNGAAYVPAGDVDFDPYAAKWWTALTVIAEMLAGQDGPLLPRQKQYLEKLLCSGMGSFSDFGLDEVRLGLAATAANARLHAARRGICEALRQA